MFAEEALAQFAAAQVVVPVEVQEMCLVGLSDSLGVGVGGLAAESAVITRSLLAEADSGGTHVWASSQRLPPRDAAWLLGVSSHALDFDDYMHPMHGHASSVVLPAAWAAGEPRGASGEELLQAYAVGYQVDWLASQAFGTAHYERGWHATSTVGVIGATAAAGRMLGLDAGQMRTAMAIAASSASGLRVNFGTHVKAMHAGNAARSAVVACELAMAGATAAADWMTGPHGMLAVMGGRVVPAEAGAAISGVLDTWGIVGPTGLMLKPYPCCGSSHAAVDSALAARADLGGAPIDRVAVHVDPLVTGILRHERPATPDEARYSLHYPIAVALLDGELTARQFSRERMSAPDVADMLRRVTVIADRSNAAHEAFAAEVEVVSGGWTVAVEVPVALGHPRRPLSTDQRRAKFVGAAAGVLGEPRAVALWDSVPRLPSLDRISDWTELVAP